jgi:hypothetical protein
MVSTEVKRTIVKSPPELWEQVNDQETLMRHLGEFGEIRITRSEPEKIVEWETDRARGKVQMKPSGWGTQVLLSVTRELPEQLPTQTDAEPDAHEETVEAPAPTLEEQPEPVQELSEPESALVASPEPETPIESPVGASEPAPQAETQADASTDVSEPTLAETQSSGEPAPRRGFFARLFKRRRDQDTGDSAGASETRPTSIETEPLPAAGEQAVLEQETAVAVLQSEPEQPVVEEGEDQPEQPLDPAQKALAEADIPAPEEGVDLAAELARAEELLSEQTAVVLTSMLDRLGAAHHRPFSRG